MGTEQFEMAHLFGTVRFVLAAIPGLALRRPIKKWAAVAALMAGAGLLFFALFLVTLAMLAWQIVTIERTNGERSLMLFKSNHWLGVALTAAFVIEGLF
jgi:4-hydroxybenzoate polyprenyltransferase